MAEPGRGGERRDRRDGQSGKFWALSHPDRLLILRRAVAPATLDELARAVGSTRQGTAKHVRILRAAGLLQERAGRRQREVKEYLVDEAELFGLSSDLARLIEARHRPAEFLAAPTALHGAGAPRIPGGPVARTSPGIAVLRAGELAFRVPLAARPDGRWVIGRSPRCEVALPHDKRVSQQHAVLRREGHGYALADLESRNGTFVNGERLASGLAAALAAGDIVRVGDTALVLQ